MTQFISAIIVKTISGHENESSSNLTELSLNQEASGIVNQYKDIIRDQDSTIKTLESKLSNLEKENIALHSHLIESQTSNSQLSDQNILLKAQLNAASEVAQQYNNQQNAIASSSSNHIEHQMSSLTIDSQSQIQFYQHENARLLNDIELYKSRIYESERLHLEISNDLMKLRKDQEDLLELFSDQDAKISLYKQQLRSLGQNIESSDEEDDDDSEDDKTKNEIK